MQETKQLALAFCKTLRIESSVFDTDDDSEAAVAGRWFCWWLMRQSGCTLVDIAASTSGGAHAPVFYACDRVSNWYDTTPVVKAYLDSAIAGKVDPAINIANVMQIGRGRVGNRFTPGDYAFYLGPSLEAKRSQVSRVIRREDRFTLIMTNNDRIPEEAALNTSAMVRLALSTAIDKFMEMDKCMEEETTPRPLKQSSQDKSGPSPTEA